MVSKNTATHSLTRHVCAARSSVGAIGKLIETQKAAQCDSILNASTEYSNLANGGRRQRCGMCRLMCRTIGRVAGAKRSVLTQHEKELSEFES
jgi:hypothetical protein